MNESSYAQIPCQSTEIMKPEGKREIQKSCAKLLALHPQQTCTSPIDKSGSMITVDLLLID